MKKLLSRLARELWLMIRMRGTTIGMITLTIFLFGSISCGVDLSPEATVSNYYNALKTGHFEQAYEYTSQKMNGGKTKEQYSEDWRKLFENGKVVILEFSVSSAKIEGDKATVRTWNRSKDMFNPDGIEEHEIDYLIKENGKWKIDETVVLNE